METAVTQPNKNSAYSVKERHFRWITSNIPCQDGCPARTNIPTYIRQVFEGKFGDAYETNRIVNIFPGVLGRICSRPCEEKCRHGERDLGTSVSICHLKRAAADHRSKGHAIGEKLFPPTGRTVAVIGAGPSGMACAHDLAVYGHEVTVFEARQKAGGMLVYGIPAFRLPREITAAEIQNIRRLGVDLKLGVTLGRDIELSTLSREFDAVVVAAGCYKPRDLDVPGEKLSGVISGLDFLEAANSGRAIASLKKAVVIGGGFTAMDCARMAIRLGAEGVTVALLTTEEEMFATAEEIREAKHEGVEILPLVMAHEFIAGGAGTLASARFVRTKLGEMLPDGLMHEAVPIENSEFEIATDAVIVAIGQSPDSSLLGAAVSMERKDDGSFRLGSENIYATGDYSSGASTVIEAVANGRKAAAQVNEELEGERRYTWAVSFEEAQPSDRERTYDFIQPLAMPTLTNTERFDDVEVEVEEGLSSQVSCEEAKRCYLCNLRFTIDVSRCIYCRYCIDVAPRDCIKLAKGVTRDETGHVTGIVETSDWSEVMAVVIDNERCIRCGNCYNICPTRCIGVTKVNLAEVETERLSGEPIK
jgi:formate dehydrogenase major subunit